MQGFLDDVINHSAATWEWIHAITLPVGFQANYDGISLDFAFIFNFVAFLHLDIIMGAYHVANWKVVYALVDL